MMVIMAFIEQIQADTAQGFIIQIRNEFWAKGEHTGQQRRLLDV